MAKKTTTPKKPLEKKPVEPKPVEKKRPEKKAPAVPPKRRSREGGRAKKAPSPTITMPADPALEILMVTSEARPFAKTGGLADVSGALPRALTRLGHRVKLVLPKYRGAHVEPSGSLAADVPFGLHRYPVRFVEQTLAEGVKAVLIDAPALYDRDGLYGDAHGEYGDNAFRFAVLCRGALEYARLKGTRPSVIHVHDWQAALTPVYARTVLRDDPIIGGVRTVLTIHN